MARRRRTKIKKMNGPWQTRPELTDRLIGLHQTTALSARDIAEALSHEFAIPITRGQVIGKAGRLGLAHRDIPSQPKSKPKRVIPIIPKPVLVLVPPIPEPPRPPSVQVDCRRLPVEMLPIVRQGAGLCRWLYDDYPYACCDQPKLEGSSYCGWHDRQVHVPPKASAQARGHS